MFKLDRGCAGDDCLRHGDNRRGLTLEEQQARKCSKTTLGKVPTLTGFESHAVSPITNFKFSEYAVLSRVKNMTNTFAKSNEARKHQGNVRSNQRNNRWFGAGLFSDGWDG